MTYKYRTLGLAAAVALAPMAASATSVDIHFQSFGDREGGGTPDIAGAILALDAFMGSSPIIGTEDFSGFTACTGSNVGSCASSPVGPSLPDTPIESPSVGDFSGVAPDDDPGGSALEPKDQIIVRDDDMGFSRYNVVGTNDNWLDSNDLGGILWEIPGTSTLSRITKIAFFLTDVDDVRAFAFEFTVSDDDEVLEEPTFSGEVIANDRPDGELLLATILFGAPVDLIDIRMKAGAGDGFGVDGIKVGTVPLPASALLLLGGLGGLGGLSALRRRKRTA